MYKEVFLFIALIFASLLLVKNASACVQYPCLFFDASDRTALQARVTGGVPAATQAYNAFATNCVFPHISSIGYTDLDEYHECATRCWLLNQSCTAAKTAFMNEINNLCYPASYLCGNPGKLHGDRAISLTISYDLLMAAGQLSASEKTLATHKLQEMANWQT